MPSLAGQDLHPCLGAVLYCPVLCCAVLRRVVLCGAVPRCAVQCCPGCAVLCCDLVVCNLCHQITLGLLSSAAAGHFTALSTIPDQFCQEQ